MILRQRQKEALDQTINLLVQGSRRIMIKAPTGFGKTVLAGALIQYYLDQNKRIIFVVDAVSLIDQTVQRFYEAGIRDVGVIQASHEMTNPNMPVQVATVQSISKRYLHHADLVIVDEAHVMYKFMGEWMEKWDMIPFVGLSATPWSKGLGKWYQELIEVTSTQDEIDDGNLSDFKVFAPSDPNLKKIKITAGDYNKKQLAERMQDNVLTASIVDTWLEKADNRATIAYCVDRTHAAHVQREFESRKITTAYIDGFTDRMERAEIERQFNNKEIQVVCSIGCLTKGIDWNVHCIIMARPTKSEMLFVQIVGRGLRTNADKDYCLILDHSKNHKTLGFTTDVDEQMSGSLNMGKKNKSGKQEKKEKLPKVCSKCSFLKHAGVHECPSCGFMPERQNSIEEEAGRLKELTRKKKKSEVVITREKKQEYYSGLLHYARELGYNSGWAAHKYKDKFGMWPRMLEKRANQPTAEVLNFIKYANIKYAKSKQAKRARA